MKLNQFYPQKCFVCRYHVAPDDFPICIHCVARMQRLLSARCINCNKPASSCICEDKTRCLFFYKSRTSKMLICRFKSYADRRILRFVAQMLIETTGINPKRFDAITYVPRLPRNKRKSGYDHSKWFAKAISEVYGIPLLDTMVRKGGKDQKMLSREERIKNIRGRYKPKNAPTEKYNHLLLIDDVQTTGATLEACAKVLREHFANRVTKACIAKTIVPKKKL